MNKSAKLISDTAYQSAYEQQSTFQFKYHTDHVPNRLEKDVFPGTCPAFPGGCRQFHVNSKAVNQYDAVIPGKPGWTRNYPSTSTELFGGAFRARGDGALLNPDALSKAWTPENGYTKHCNRRLSEVTYDTWSCVDVTNESEAVFDLRGGIGTRMGLQYLTKC
jgi:hypothetical protein